MDTIDYNDWSQSAMVELSVAKCLFRGYTPAPASPPRSSTSCEARLVLSEYLTFSCFGGRYLPLIYPSHGGICRVGSAVSGPSG